MTSSASAVGSKPTAGTQSSAVAPKLLDFSVLAGRAVAALPKGEMPPSFSVFARLPVTHASTKVGGGAAAPEALEPARAGAAAREETLKRKRVDAPGAPSLGSLRADGARVDAIPGLSIGPRDDEGDDSEGDDKVRSAPMSKRLAATNEADRPEPATAAVTIVARAALPPPAVHGGVGSCQSLPEGILSGLGKL